MLFLIISFLVVADLLALVTIGYVFFDVARQLQKSKKTTTQR
jgi:hypothetical protein